MTSRRKITPAKLVETYLSRKPNTRRCYVADMEAFAKWVGVGNIEAIAGELIRGGRFECRRKLLGWINEMRGKNLSGNTVRRRIASVVSLLTLAADLNMIEWNVGRLPLPPAIRVRDCCGPTVGAVKRMFAVCQERNDAKGARDEAILALLYWHGLRAGEVLSLRVNDVDLHNSTMRIIGKRNQGRMALGLATKTVDLLEQWIDYRPEGKPSEPLFTTCPRNAKATRKGLTYWGLLDAIRCIGEQAGSRCWPHALRHAAVTHLAGLTFDSLPWGMALSRHRDVRAWQLYHDRRISHVSAAEILSRGQIVSVDPPTTDN